MEGECVHLRYVLESAPYRPRYLFYVEGDQSMSQLKGSFMCYREIENADEITGFWLDNEVGTLYIVADKIKLTQKYLTHIM